jgi:isobutyryl-CoA mutase
MSTAARELDTLQGREARPLRFVTAASLFDGHDAAINIIRRILQAHGAEVVHLGHNRSVADIVRAALQEDADGIAVSSYQGGHNEYFRYMVDRLREHGAEHIRVVVGGGGTISPAERRALEKYGVERVYGPEEGHAARPGGHDRGRAQARPQRAAAPGAGAGGRWPDEISCASAARSASSSSRRSEIPRRWRLPAAPSEAAGRAKRAGRRHYGDRRRRQVEPDRRTAEPVPALISGPAVSPCWRSTRPDDVPAARCLVIAFA